MGKEGSVSSGRLVLVCDGVGGSRFLCTNCLHKALQLKGRNDGWFASVSHRTIG